MMPLRTPEKPPADFLNIAHRGARAFAPENTLAAFQKAKTFACQLFEIDVRLSKDGELMVHHDEQLTRCTDVKEKFPHRTRYSIWDFTYEELNTLDAGSWYSKQLSLPYTQRQEFLQTLTDDELTRFVSPQERTHYASGNIKLPSLKQTLEFARYADMMVNIELKTQPNVTTELAEKVVKLVEVMNMGHQVLISSFEHEQLRKVRQLTKTIAIAVLTNERIENLNNYLQLLDATAYHPNCYGDRDATGLRKLNLDDIAMARKGGHQVNVWTCNNKDDMRQLIAAGVTGLISDFPNRVQDVLLEY
jgi:glycerophosphoryl diester phosphodiesterase